MEEDTFIPQYRTFIRDFYAKDIRTQDKSISISKSKKMGAEIADKIIDAADSLGNFISDIYSQGMLRFSVHGKPIHNVDKKIGIYLNSMGAECPMPWHGAAVKIPISDKFLYEKKFLLENAGAKFVPDIDGKGCWYNYPNRIFDPKKSLKENLFK